MADDTGSQIRPHPRPLPGGEGVRGVVVDCVVAGCVAGPVAGCVAGCVAARLSFTFWSFLSDSSTLYGPVTTNSPLFKPAKICVRVASLGPTVTGVTTALPSITR